MDLDTCRKEEEDDIVLSNRLKIILENTLAENALPGDKFEVN